MNRLTILIICALTVFSAGCASTRSTQFYTLSPSAAKPATQKAGYAVSVGPVSMPAVVDRAQMVLQTEPNQVYIAEFDRWAAPLKEEIARIIAINLASMLGASPSTVFPSAAATDASYRVVIDILRFESALNQAATLDARWTVTSRPAGRSRSGHAAIVEPTDGGGYAGLAAAHSRALEQLSGEIAEAIKALEDKRQ